MNSVHSVKILLCYILDKLNRTVTEEQLRLISEDSGVISYFFFSDALEELIANGSVEVTEEDGRRIISITEKGRLGSEYFNRYIPLVFRKKLLHSAFSFFVREENEGMCSCDVIPNVSPTVPTADAASYRQEDSGRFSYTLIKTPPPKNSARYIVRMVAAVLTAPQSTLRPKNWALSR